MLSPAAYNGRTGLMLCRPVTTRIRGYPFEVRLRTEPASAVLSDQVRCLDWRACGAKRKARVGAAEVAEVRGKLRALIG